MISALVCASFWLTFLRRCTFHACIACFAWLVMNPSSSMKSTAKRNKESTWSTCCVLLSQLVLLLQLVKPPLIYVLRGHDIGDEDKHGTRCLLTKMALLMQFLSSTVIPATLGPRWTHWLTSFELFADGKGLIITETANETTRHRRRAMLLHLAGPDKKSFLLPDTSEKQPITLQL